MADKVVPLRKPEATCRYGYEAADALALVEELRVDDARVVPGAHAFERMQERDVSYTQALRVLRRGELVEGPALDKDTQWRMRYRGYDAGQDISVVVTLERDRMGELLIVVTTITH